LGAWFRRKEVDSAAAVGPGFPVPPGKSWKVLDFYV